MTTQWLMAIIAIAISIPTVVAVIYYIKPPTWACVPIGFGVGYCVGATLLLLVRP